MQIEEKDHDTLCSRLLSQTGKWTCVLLIISFRHQTCQKIGLTEHQTQSLVSKIGDQEIKDKLKDTTQKALDMGVGRQDNAQYTP